MYSLFFHDLLLPSWLLTLTNTSLDSSALILSHVFGPFHKGICGNFFKHLQCCCWICGAATHQPAWTYGETANWIYSLTIPVSLYSPWNGLPTLQIPSEFEIVGQTLPTTSALDTCKHCLFMPFPDLDAISSHTTVCESIRYLGTYDHAMI